MLPCFARNLVCALALMGWGWGASFPAILAQWDGGGEWERRYSAVVMEVLSSRLAADVGMEDGKVFLRTPASRTVKDMGAIIQASVPYYLEGSLAEFKRFRPRVKEALSALDGWQVPPAPKGWESAEWTYFQVQGKLEDVVLLVSLDVGVFANEALATSARARAELERDWTQIRGGSDPMRPMPLPDFGGGGSDGSTLDGLGQGGAGAGGGSGELDIAGLTEALRALTARIDALEGRRPAGTLPGTPPLGTGWPTQGPDGRLSPAGAAGGAPRPESLPEQFTLQFPSGSGALGLSAEYGLNTLVEWMAAYPRLRVLVTGHSDAVGSERSNMELSRRRAQVVRYYLMERGIAADRVSAAHFGEERPEWGAGLDRRVEVRLLWD